MVINPIRQSHVGAARAAVIAGAIYVFVDADTPEALEVKDEPRSIMLSRSSVPPHVVNYVLLSSRAILSVSGSRLAPSVAHRPIITGPMMAGIWREKCEVGHTMSGRGGHERAVAGPPQFHRGIGTASAFSIPRWHSLHCPTGRIIRIVTA